jgi:uncharacterized protein YjaG (DUF416 family)
MVTFADEVRTRLTELDRPRLARFAVACAARMEPVFTTFWRSTRPETYRNWIDELWSNVDELSPDLAESVIESVMETPESMVDDSNRPDYYALRVLGSVVYAAQTMTDDDHLKAAMSASSTTVSVLRDFDHALAGGHRSLADAELAAQRADLERLVVETGEGMLLAARSSALYSELGPATQEVTEVNDWDLSGRPD